jgi:hypothetical protein
MHRKLAMLLMTCSSIFLKEDTMLEVTPAATEQIAAYFSDKEVRPVRIFLNEGG